jgi:3-hydroxyisobutyrate dehydrogenase
MVGGEDVHVAKCLPVFATYSDAIVHLGPLGSGQAAKILNNLLFSANLGTAFSVLQVGRDLRVAPARFLEVLGRSSAKSVAMDSLATFGGAPEKLGAVAGALLRKDVALAATLAGVASATTGAVFPAADAALDAMGHAR